MSVIGGFVLGVVCYGVFKTVEDGVCIGSEVLNQRDTTLNKLESTRKDIQFDQKDLDNFSFD